MKVWSPALYCIVLTIVIRISICDSNNSPYIDCNSMMLSNGVEPETSLPPPYDIQISEVTYCEDSTVTVTIAGNPQDIEFEAFLCQPRTDTSIYETVGTFSQPTSTTNNCSNNAALTTNTTRKSIQFTWTPGFFVKEPVYIVCTVVQDENVYWTHINSNISYAGDSECHQSSGELSVTCPEYRECMRAVENVCQSETCVCPPDMKLANPTDMYCSPKVLHDGCTNDNECKFISHSKCIDGTCGCPKAGYVEVQNVTHSICSTTSTATSFVLSVTMSIECLAVIFFLK